MSKRISNEVKLMTVKNIINNRVGLRDAARSLGIAYQSIQKWIAIYKGFGTEGFNKTNGNHKYTSELKRQAVTEYLDGNSSLMDNGRLPGEAMQDEEGIQIMRILGKNMAWLMKLIKNGQGVIKEPEREEKIFTNFIR